MIINKQYKIIYDEEIKIASEKGDCDCACVNNSLLEHQPIHKLELNTDLVLKQCEDLVFQKVNDEYTFVLSPNNPHSRAIMNSAAKALLDCFISEKSVNHVLALQNNYPKEYTWDTLSTLEKLSFIQPLNNIKIDDFSHLTNKNANLILNAWLHITNACNLQCSYCFLDKTNQKMSLETGYKSINAIFTTAKRNGFQSVKIKYAGGEPTLNVDLIEQLHTHATHRAKELNIEYNAVILSNGTLITEKLVSLIRENNIYLMISLDGIGEFHNNQRPFINGKGSFDIIDRNVSRLMACNINPFITVTISSQSAPGLASVVSYVLDRNLPFTLNFFRSNAYLPIDRQFQLDEKKIIYYMREAYQIIEERMPKQSLLGSLLDLNNAGVPHDKTCGVGENYLVIDQFGGVSKCHMDIENPLTTINDPDILQAITSDVKGIQNLHYNQKSGCDICEWRYWCTGGCPLVTYRAYGRYDLKSPNCSIYKSLYPEVLRLEGMRLLKYFST